MQKGKGKSITQTTSRSTMKESSKTIKETGSGNTNMKMEIIMRGNGNRIKHLGRGCSNM